MTTAKTPAGTAPALPDHFRAALHKAIADRAVDEGDCLVWTGVYNNKAPQLFVDGKYHLVRRLLWQVECGPIPTGQHPRLTCGNPRCVELAHIRLRTTRQIAKEVAKTGAYSGLLRRAKISAARRKAGKLTQADVDRIRAADNGAAIARELGISKSAAANIRAGKAWAVSIGSPWMGLMP